MAEHPARGVQGVLEGILDGDPSNLPSIAKGLLNPQGGEEVRMFKYYSILMKAGGEYG